MSALAEEIVKRLSRKQKSKRLSIEVPTVDKVLEDLSIPTSASKGVPVGLRVKRVAFSGTKRLPPEHPDAEGHPIEEVGATGFQLELGLNDAEQRAESGLNDASVWTGETNVADEGVDEKVPRALVPFAFEWEPQEGVNGIGSGRNLRGKSTIMNLLLWSLSGRCTEFSPDTRRWIEHVEVDWLVGNETLRVSFDAENGVANNGRVTSLRDDGGAENVVARFDGDSFEDAMSSVMLNRLRLEIFTVSQAGKAVPHKWASYVNALWVRPKYLKSIIGKEPVLSIRLMQMFIGTDWVPVLAAASTVAGVLASEQKANQERTKTATDAVGAARVEAQKKVDDFQAQIAALPAGTPDLAKTTAASLRAGDIALEIHALETQLLNRSVAADTIRQQIKAAKARQHTEYEHSLLTKFFHQMEPTVCPRCTATVTKARRAAEPDEHKCSVCTSDLNLEALKAKVVIAASVDIAVASSLVDSASVNVAESDEQHPAPRSEIDALSDALQSAESGIAPLRSRRDELAEAREVASNEAVLDTVLLAAARERQKLEIELARAEGAVDALALSVTPAAGMPVDPIHLAVAEGAVEVLTRWVKLHQDPLLMTISGEIERLTVSFGGDSLSHFKLDGAANLSLRKGGDPASYGQLTPGEQLRVKIATVIALIKHGYAENIGRHPGFLLLDSPAAEEMPDGDLATMVSALLEVAREAPMQIIVATRNTGPLEELLHFKNRIIATGNDYVW
ncbi:ATP-binding protein [Cryobacterium sp. PAMC25264]|uniref:ATP-binding protein n=1 Tax=Cryobacterium sp. PAMC25264 TaxID=2861288 RepID=UPI001C63320F|nr:ATP-binding protein [Cryobacterium sp. PAMC25264]QYF74396.1 hypothetical protein KY500_04090 [Cryobacterium sp. PAMC25264]